MEGISIPRLASTPRPLCRIKRSSPRCAISVPAAPTLSGSNGGGGGSDGGGGGGGGGDSGSGDEDAGSRDSGNGLSLLTQLMRSRPRLVLVASCGTLLFAYHYSDEGVTASMCRVLEAGGVHGWQAPFVADQLPLVARPQLREELTRMLRPGDYAQYAVIVGAAGTGKSTAVRTAIAALEKPKGVVYYLCSTLLIGFSSDLATSCGYYCPIRWADRLVRLLTGESKAEASAPPVTSEPHATWQRLEPRLIAAAQRYRAKHGAPAVLVLDGLDLVAKEDAAFFTKLQDFAKKCADMRILRLVLVFSDGCALPMLQSSSAFTRAGRVLEVGDLSDADALQWLVQTLRVEPQRAQTLVQTVAGGRFPLLLSAAASEEPLDAMRRTLDVQTRLSLRRAGVAADARLLRALRSQRVVGADEAETMMQRDVIERLLAYNILSVHPDRTYTFHDRHVEYFFDTAARR